MALPGTLVLWNTALGSRVLVLPGLFLLVLIQQISSHRLKPHFLKHCGATKTYTLRDKKHHRYMTSPGARGVAKKMHYIAEALQREPMLTRASSIGLNTAVGDDTGSITARQRVVMVSGGHRAVDGVECFSLLRSIGRSCGFIMRPHLKA